MFPVLLIGAAVAGVAAINHNRQKKLAATPPSLIPVTNSGIPLNSVLHTPNRVTAPPIAISEPNPSMNLGDTISHPVRPVYAPPVTNVQNVPPGWTNQFGSAFQSPPPSRTYGSGGRDMPPPSAPPPSTEPPPRVTPPPPPTPPPASVSVANSVPNSQGYYDLLAQAHLNNCDPRDSSCVSNNVARQVYVQTIWDEKYHITGAPANLVLTFHDQTADQVRQFYDPSNPFEGGNVVNINGIGEEHLS